MLIITVRTRPAENVAGADGRVYNWEDLAKENER